MGDKCLAELFVRAKFNLTNNLSYAKKGYNKMYNLLQVETKTEFDDLISDYSSGQKKVDINKRDLQRISLLYGGHFQDNLLEGKLFRKYRHVIELFSYIVETIFRNDLISVNGQPKKLTNEELLNLSKEDGEYIINHVKMLIDKKNECIKLTADSRPHCTLCAASGDQNCVDLEGGVEIMTLRRDSENVNKIKATNDGNDGDIIVLRLDIDDTSSGNTYYLEASDTASDGKSPMLDGSTGCQSVFIGPEGADAPSLGFKPFTQSLSITAADGTLSGGEQFNYHVPKDWWLRHQDGTTCRNGIVNHTSLITRAGNSTQKGNKPNNEVGNTQGAITYDIDYGGQIVDATNFFGRPAIMGGTGYTNKDWVPKCQGHTSGCGPGNSYDSELGTNHGCLANKMYECNLSKKQYRVPYLTWSPEARINPTTEGPYLPGTNADRELVGNAACDLACIDLQRGQLRDYSGPFVFVDPDMGGNGAREIKADSSQVPANDRYGTGAKASIKSTYTGDGQLAHPSDALSAVWCGQQNLRFGYESKYKDIQTSLSGGELQDSIPTDFPRKNLCPTIQDGGTASCQPRTADIGLNVISDGGEPIHSCIIGSTYRPYIEDDDNDKKFLWKLVPLNGSDYVRYNEKIMIVTAMDGTNRPLSMWGECGIDVTQPPDTTKNRKCIGLHKQNYTDLLALGMDNIPESVIFYITKGSGSTNNDMVDTTNINGDIPDQTKWKEQSCVCAGDKQGDEIHGCGADENISCGDDDGRSGWTNIGIGLQIYSKIGNEKYILTSNSNNPTLTSKLYSQRPWGNIEGIGMARTEITQGVNVRHLSGPEHNSNFTSTDDSFFKTTDDWKNKDIDDRKNTSKWTQWKTGEGGNIACPNGSIVDTCYDSLINNKHPATLGDPNSLKNVYRGCNTSVKQKDGGLTENNDFEPGDDALCFYMDPDVTSAEGKWFIEKFDKNETDPITINYEPEGFKNDTEESDTYTYSWVTIMISVLIILILCFKYDNVKQILNHFTKKMCK